MKSTTIASFETAPSYETTPPYETTAPYDAPSYGATSGRQILSRRTAASHTGTSVALPDAARAARIGIFGASLNPVHIGHRHAITTAMKALQLDAVWIVPCLSNPLKNNSLKDSGDLPIDRNLQRLEIEKLLDLPKVHTVEIDQVSGFNFSFETLLHIAQRRSDLRLVWIAGADLMSELHLWQHADRVAQIASWLFIHRPATHRLPRLSAFNALHTAHRATVPELRRFLYRPQANASVQLRKPWAYLVAPGLNISSSALRSKIM